MFVIFNSKNNGNETVPIVVNIYEIAHICEEDYLSYRGTSLGKFRKITLNNRDFVYVTESIEDIMNILNKSSY